MRILVIFTGGTIGSEVREAWIAPDVGMKARLLEQYRRTHGDEICFDTVEPYRILSENLEAAHLNALFACVQEHLNQGYDGILVTHGTDTLQYTAAALRYVFGAVRQPIVLVSSNYPLTDPRANGGRNFEAAVEFLKTDRRAGVFAAYANEGEPVRILSASRLLSHGEMQDALFSVSEADRDQAEDCPLGEVRLHSDSGILVVSSYPGDRFSYSLEGIRAVLMRPYHSGTLATASEPLRSFCFLARQQRIPVFLTGVYSSVSYDSTRGFEELGIQVLPKSAFPSMYMKLWLGISLGRELKTFMQETLAGEFSS